MLGNGAVNGSGDILSSFIDEMRLSFGFRVSEEENDGDVEAETAEAEYVRAWRIGLYADG